MIIKKEPVAKAADFDPDTATASSKCCKWHPIN
jgi:hypothetical protein